ncbi:HsdM family class I SAM-dependent methyltransferase [Francisella philomiragia]|uniref:site-specific DNA-methyltransferase (adenine-specific) n=1 Tax=Francisella philomiragia TaxID=28110 RepID=A0A0B6D6R9_9GAMM|nr:N-6 DNA methylase [Francisella philomiragia]AJI53957.1 methyltransferase small domain protein [Francisella philomiragia]
MTQKDKGSFFTPREIATWIVGKLLKGIETSNILEPSCGEGVFIDVLLEQPEAFYSIDAVEIDAEVFNKSLMKYTNKVNVFCEDFLFIDFKKKYDFILGNPPYVVKKRLSEIQIAKCKEIHMEHNLNLASISNVWTAFLLKSISLLKEDGVLAFVLPTELLQVNYSEEIRNLLLKEFDLLEVVSFKKLAFESIEQDTVILFAYKESKKKKGLFFAEVSSIEELASAKIDFVEHHGNHEAKWTSYILTEDDFAFIKKISTKCLKVSDVCKSVTGIVTGANDFFILTKKDVKKFNLQKYVKKIIKKGSYINNIPEITAEVFLELEKNQKPCYLLDLNGIKEEAFPKSLKDYLNLGNIKGINNRYKCSKRPRWFDVPSIWSSDGLFFKRGHNHLSLINNSLDVYSTDSAYRITMNDGFDIKSFVFSFYNSFTLLHTELLGRYYGGGVLELTPNEFKRLPIPMIKCVDKTYENFLKVFKGKTSIEEFVKIHDDKILSNFSELSKDDLARVRYLYNKLKKRRLER